MPDTALVDYISSLRKQNIDDPTIKQKLLSAGWDEKQVSSALVPAGTIDTPPPPPPVHFGMWVTFLYVILFISLYVWASAFAGILNYAVDQHISNSESFRNAYDYGYSPGTDPFLTGFAAAILVSFPIFVVVFLILRRQSIQKPGVKNLKSRKQLIYITLVITFLLIICHLIVIVYGFLNGAATANSLGHLGVTLLVAGSIFAYLLTQVISDRRGDA